MTKKEFIIQFDEVKEIVDKHPDTAASGILVLKELAKQFIKDNIHEPDYEEGITAEELAHQFYGAKCQKQIDTDKFCEKILYGLMHDFGCDIPNVEKVKEYIRQKMEE